MTITSNIHVGLPGWSNATYSVGQRRSNAGNAYQVITAGTSTSPPTGTGSNITPGGTSAWKWLSAVDYSTLQAWADGIPATLTQPVVGLVWNDGVITATAGTAILTLSGHTTSGTNTITLAPATGEGFLATFQAAPTTPYRYNNASGVSIEFPATGFGGINYIQIDDSNVILRGLQINDLNASSGASIIGGSGVVWVDKSIVVGQSQTGGANMVGQDGSIRITNSLIIDNSVGNPGSTVASLGVGCAIAYTTMVKTAPSTGSTALNSRSNSTVASNTVIGCIFVGYDVPFIAVAQTWATNHNAYTNSSFTSTASATDTGGSVYGATTSTLFVAPTTDYHQNPTSPCLNAGATDTTDIPTADDTFGTSRPQGASWDIGPHELLAGSVILRDFIHPFSFERSLFLDMVGAAAWGFGLSGNIIGSADWKTAKTFDTPISVGNELVFSFTSPITPIEWQSSVIHPVKDVIFPIEWKATIAADRIVSHDGRSPINQDATTGTDWRGISTRDAVMTSEFGTSRSADYVLPQTANITKFSDQAVSTVFSRTFSADVAHSVEWRGSSITFVDAGVPIEWRGPFTTFSDTAVPIEWLGFSITSADVPVPIDWRSSFTQSTASSIEFGKPVQTDAVSLADWKSALVGADYVAAIEAKAVQVTDAAGNIDWVLPLSVTTPASMDSGLSVINTVPSSLEFTQSVALTITAACDPYLLLLADKIGSLEPSVSRSTSIVAPSEIGGGTGVGIPADSVMALEWRSGVISDAVINVSMLSTLKADITVPLSSDAGRVVDYSLGSAFSNTPLMTIIVPSDWGHLTLGMTVDMIASLEFLATVQADITVSSNRLVGQRSIGSQLEPDEWEEENEPT